MKKNIIWKLTEGDGPLVATAIHDGHELREEIKSNIALSERDQLREEDPFTSDWTGIGNFALSMAVIGI